MSCFRGGAINTCASGQLIYIGQIKFYIQVFCLVADDIAISFPNIYQKQIYELHMAQVAHRGLSKRA